MAILDLSILLSTLTPTLRDGEYAFAVWNLDASPPPLTVALFRESEGTTIILPTAAATDLGLTVHFRAAWIELRVLSDLAAVGLTAAVATALAEAGISCNVMAAVHHDHLFVPTDQAQHAMSVLKALQARHSLQCQP